MKPEWITAVKWALKQATVDVNCHSNELERLESYKMKGPATVNRIKGNRLGLEESLTRQRALTELLAYLEGRLSE